MRYTVSGKLSVYYSQSIQYMLYAEHDISGKWCILYGIDSHEYGMYRLREIIYIRVVSQWWS